MLDPFAKLKPETRNPKPQTQTPFMYSIIHVFYYSIIPAFPQPASPGPSGLAALQIPRSTRPNFAQPQPQP